MKEKKTTTIVMDMELYNKSVKAAEDIGLNFNNYVRMLLSKELKKTTSKI